MRSRNNSSPGMSVRIVTPAMEGSEQVVSLVSRAYGILGFSYSTHPCRVDISGSEATISISEGKGPVHGICIIGFSHGSPCHSSHIFPYAEGYGALFSEDDAVDSIVGYMLTCHERKLW